MENKKQVKRPACKNCGRRMTLGQTAQSGKKRWECKRGDGAGGRVYCSSTTNPNGAQIGTRSGRRPKTPIFKRSLGGATTIVVTAAQNGTPVHGPFMKSLEVLCNHRNAELVVVPIRYKNPTSRWTESQANDEVWADEVQPYLCNQRKRLNKNLVLLGDSKVQPTAANPLTGYEPLTHGESGLIGHPQLALTTIPTPQNSYPKILSTTGACTVPKNYTDSRAGKLGEFHHTIGAALVEIRGKYFHLRQLNAVKATGEFIDIRDHYTPSGVKRAARAKALVMGDTHRDYIAKSVVPATFGLGGMVEVFEPEAMVWHDLDDNHAVNPHHGKNPFIKLAKIKSGRMDPRAELERAIEFVVENTPGNAKSYIVWSNHNEFLRRWVEETDPRSEPANLEFWSQTAQHMARETRLGDRGVEYPDPFVYWARRLLENVQNVVVLDRKDKLIIAGINCGMHGHKGPNGSRGSRRNLAQIGVKSIIAHGHGPGICRGCTQVGTSTELDAEYTDGPGSWLQTHGTINALDKRCLHNIIKGKWRL